MIREGMYFLFLASAIFFAGCRSVSIKDVVGVYVNINFDYEPFLVEIPYSSDTLILKNDYSFKSSYYGEGNFELGKDRIKLIYGYGYGTASYEAPIELDLYGNVKIILFRLEDHHYKKILQ